METPFIEYQLRQIVKSYRDDPIRTKPYLIAMYELIVAGHEFVRGVLRKISNLIPLGHDNHYGRND